MAPILYYNNMSPPVRAVLLTERALGVELEKKEISIKNGDHLTAEYLQMNPQHTVPTLNDDGFCIWDSHAIIAYLVGKYGKDDSLYPKDIQKRAVVDQRLHFDSGILFPSLKAIFFPMFFLGVKDISQKKADALIKGLAFLETFLENRKWMAGDHLTIADLCIGASVSSTEALESLIPVSLDKYPRVQAWMNRVKTLPYYEEANGRGLQKLKALVKQSVEE